MLVKIRIYRLDSASEIEDIYININSIMTIAPYTKDGLYSIMLTNGDHYQIDKKSLMVIIEADNTQHATVEFSS